jgi:hypothetical protein
LTKPESKDQETQPTKEPVIEESKLRPSQLLEPDPHAQVEKKVEDSVAIKEGTRNFLRNN